MTTGAKYVNARTSARSNDVMLYPSELGANGKALGRKGRQTRERLLDAAEQLLKSKSPMELTAAAIAKKAGTVSSTLYIYFKDLDDLYFALSERAGRDMEELVDLLHKPFDDVDVFANLVVRTFFNIWQRHK